MKENKNEVKDTVRSLIKTKFSFDSHILYTKLLILPGSLKN